MAYISFQPTDHFVTHLYTANGSTNAQTIGLEPGLTWIKKRSSGSSHYLFDELRGTNAWNSDSNAQQSNQSGQGFTSLDANGFTLSGTGGGGGVNDGTNTFASWNWKAPSASIPSGNNNAPTLYDCHINTTAGFGMYRYNSDPGDAAVNQIVHGLGKTPQMVLVKKYEQGSGGDNTTREPIVYNARTDGDLTQAGDFFQDLSTDAVRTNNSGVWGDLVMTDTVINLAGDGQVARTGNYMCYAFCNIPGFSSYSRYFGTNRSHGSFIYTGFKPALIMLKTTGVTGGWYMYDQKRGYNGARPYLQANATSAEDTNEGNFGIDILANGFKIHGTYAGINADGGGILYMAMAEHPLVSSNGKAATAL